MVLLMAAHAATGPVLHTFAPTKLGEPPYDPCVVAPAQKPPDAEAAEPPPPKDYGDWPVLEPTTELRTPIEALQGDPADLARIRAVWQRAAKHKTVTRVAVWGDSHTIGDLLPGHLRTVLQARYGDAGSGYLLPFSINGTLQPGRASTCKREGWVSRAVARAAIPQLGPAGTATTARQATTNAWLALSDEARPRAKMSVSVLYFYQPEAGTLQLTVDRAAPIVLPTAGAAAPAVARFDLPLGPHRLSFATDGEGPVRIGGVVVEREAPGGGGVVVDGLGSGGRALGAWTLWDAESMQAWNSWRPYDLYLISSGSAELGDPQLTEAEYRTQVKTALAAFRRIEPDAACVLIGPGDRGHRLDDGRVVLHANHEWGNRVLRELAPSAHCATWSIQGAMGGAGTAPAWAAAGLMQTDLLHFTAAGYQLLANQLMNQIDPR